MFLNTLLISCFCLQFWSFLVSLTAKDCSLMVAIQRAEYFSNSGVVQSSSSSNTSSAPIWCSVHREPTTGHRYVVSISLTDLDFKQAYKVERSLHNDRRMVKAFWGALAKEPTAFPSDLHFCDLFPTSSTSTTSSTSSSSSLPPLSHSLLLWSHCVTLFSPLLSYTSYLFAVICSASGHHHHCHHIFVTINPLSLPLLLPPWTCTVNNLCSFLYLCSFFQNSFSYFNLAKLAI